MRTSFLRLQKWIKTTFKKNLKVGLALSGGATFGAAHIGVLQVLEAEGIRPDIVTGTSVGALVGATYCSGIPLNELEQLFLTMEWPTLIKISGRHSLSFFDTQPMEEFLKKKMGDCLFSDLDLPFAAIACDLMTGERVVLDHGAVVPAIRASAAIPSLFSPVEINHRLLVDGGLVDNLPVEQARAMGADLVIASDVSNRSRITKAPNNPIEVLLTMFNIMQDHGALVNSDDCDFYIRPQISQYSYWGFADAAKVLVEGKKSAEIMIPELKKTLRIS